MSGDAKSTSLNCYDAHSYDMFVCGPPVCVWWDPLLGRTCAEDVSGSIERASEGIDRDCVWTDVAAVIDMLIEACSVVLSLAYSAHCIVVSDVDGCACSSVDFHGCDVASSVVSECVLL